MREEGGRTWNHPTLGMTGSTRRVDEERVHGEQAPHKSRDLNQ